MQEDRTRSPLRIEDDVLLERVRAVAAQLGRTPEAREVPAAITVAVRFGGWNKALVAAGLEPARPLSREYLIAMMQKKAFQLGHTPTSTEINADPLMPSSSSYNRKFGGYRAAAVAAGLDTDNLQVPGGTYTSALDHHLRTKYAITEAEYWALNEAQGSVCRICGLPETWISSRNSGRVTRLSVDHCHSTGVVRGLLCNRCNKILGVAGDDPALLDAMAGYLRNAQPVAGSG